MANFLKLGITLVVSLVIANFISIKWSAAHYEDQYAQAIKKQEAFVKQQQQNLAARMAVEERGVNSKANIYNQAIQARMQAQTSSKDTWKSNGQHTSQVSQLEKAQHRKLANEKKQQAIAKLNLKRKRHAEHLRSVRAQNDKTCNYWRDEYSSNNSLYNKKHLTSACNRAEND